MKKEEGQHEVSGREAFASGEAMGGGAEDKKVTWR